MRKPNPGGTRVNGRPARYWKLVAAAALGLCSLAALGAKPPALQTDTDLATAGYFRLTWHWPGADNRRFELQEAPSPEFVHPQTLYQGPDRATLVSGQPDGQYYFRVRLHPRDARPGPWSEPVAVDVEHHSLARAFAFFAIGATVFLATLVLVVGGNWRARRQENA